jgi:thiol-disulfide isomerase/thioredoxin
MRKEIVRKLFLILAGLLVIVGCVLTAKGQITEGGALTPLRVPAPDFPKPGADVSGTTWINSPPLTLADLHGKVVLIDFWEYTCINCLRTFEQNKKWYERYHKDGFEIVGVHAPEFDVAYSVDNVREAVKRFGLPYPVVADHWFTIWKSYKNDSWPSRFLIDANGVVRYHRDGEGADGDFERAIRALLVEAHPELKFSAAEKVAPNEDAFAASCGVPTGEMYVGPWYNRGALANAEGYQPGKTVHYKLPGSVADGHAILSGPWETDQNGMIYRGKPQAPGPRADRLEMRYHARELYSVMNVTRGAPSKLYILQDGKDLTAANQGVDVKLDAAGHSYIDVNASRMYYLVANPEFGSHTVTLVPTAPGFTINSFTFGNNCQTKFPHL